MAQFPPLSAFCGWQDAGCTLLAGDASARRYYRLRKDGKTAVLMDASRNPESIAPFVLIGNHLRGLGFSAPAILAHDEPNRLLLLEDFGDDSFAQLLENGRDPEKLYALATDLLIALHRHPQAIPAGLRVYTPEKMLEDIGLFIESHSPALPEKAKSDFRETWSKVLPLAHQVPTSLLLRDYHAANLMLLPHRAGVLQAGLLDFQDAYRGPVTYDLVSLLQDARRDISDDLAARMLSRYAARFTGLDAVAFDTSLAVVAAQRHTRVLGIFEKLSRGGGKAATYKQLHSSRVARLLQKALNHPALAGVQRWHSQYAPEY